MNALLLAAEAPSHLDALFGGLQDTLAWSSFRFLLIGIAVGFVVGILPGVGGPVALALMLPFTFDMEPIQAFSFLLGMQSVTATTGDITSILFGVPGEASSAALVVDGYPMTKQGQAGRALGAALMSSLVGAIIGAAVLAAAIPFVRPIVLSFGSPELLMMVILSLTFVGALSGGVPLKGLIAGGVGLLVSSVGMDPQSGVQRFTFDQLHLWEGIGLVPMAVGLFGISELFDLAIRATSISDPRVGKVKGVAEGVRDTFRHFWLTARCSALGAIVGILPGMGAAVSQWLAYGHAVQSSPHQTNFGKGAIEGVIGPGAANNSKEGGALIPTVAFGVPGGTTMAILLGAFLIQGLQPGPEMLTTHLDLTLSFVWMIVIANIITVAVCLTFVGQLAKVTFVRVGLLIPPILLLTLIGAYGARNNMFDVWVMLGFGVLGTLMVWFDWPRAPLVLGLVLGPLCENYLFLTTQRYGMSWLSRPGVMIISVLIFGALGSTVVRWRKTRRKVAA